MYYIAVDVQAQALVTATRNVAYNGYDDEARLETFSCPPKVEPYGIVPPADLVVANIFGLDNSSDPPWRRPY